MNPQRAATLVLRHGWNRDPARVGSTQAPTCIEVYPHPAMIALLRLGRILEYKSGELTTRQAAFTQLLDHLEAIHTLSLGTSHAGAISTQ